MVWRVLIADDDPVIGTLLTTMLGKRAYDIVLCGDAEQALERLTADPPYDLLVSDFMLPGISGLDLIAQVRQNDATASLPIVMISGHGGGEMEQRARDAGANAFLGKPFTLAEVRTVVGRLLGDASESVPRG